MGGFDPTGAVKNYLGDRNITDRDMLWLGTGGLSETTAHTADALARFGYEVPEYSKEGGLFGMFGDDGGIAAGGEDTMTSDREKAATAKQDALDLQNLKESIAQGNAEQRSTNMKAGVLAKQETAEATDKVTERDKRKGRRSLLAGQEGGVGTAPIGLGDTGSLGV